MVDMEKVIRAVDSCFDYWLDKHGYLSQLELERVRQFKADALAMLKEQGAKPPRVHENAYGRKFYYCPKCNRAFDYFNQESYCHDCGQEVKWG